MPLTPPPSAPPAAPTAPGDAPQRANPGTFRVLADAFIAWLVTFRNSMADLRAWLADYITWAGVHVEEMNTLQTNIDAVMGDISSVNAVAGDLANIDSVGGSIANVNSVAGSLPNVNTVAGAVANVNTVAGAVANVNTVAGAAANVATVASNVGSVSTVASNMSTVQQAVTASATAGVYPSSAASNVPRGLTQASVGAITGGTGGANGTNFTIAWSGGNFLVNPTGTFTVAGGVLTAVTITGPGLYIGSAPSLPTPSFAASSGLTGAAVALTAQFLVTSGQGYWVQSADGLWLDRYNNVSGVATRDTTVASVPSGALKGAAAGALLELQTSSGTTVQAILADGTSIAKLRPRSLDAPLTTTIGGKSVSRLILEDAQSLARRELSLWIDKALAHTEAAYPVSNTLIFSNGLDSTGFGQIRMACAQMCADGVTALVWGFTSETSTDDFGMGSLIYKRLTWNKTTRTWGIGAFTYFERSTVDPDGGSTQGRWISLSTCSLWTGPHPGRIFAIYCWQNTLGKGTRVFTRYSDDYGVTWSARSEVTSQFPIASSWGIVAPGPAPSLQIRNGQYAGRIVVPAWRGTPSYPADNNNLTEFPFNYRSMLLYSDDYGATWTVGVQAPLEQTTDSNECAVAETWRGDLIWAIRTTAFGATKCLYTVKDGGTTLSSDAYPMVDANGNQIATSQVMCGLIQAANVNPMRSSAPKLLLTLPNDPASRQKVTCFASYDGGQTWPASAQITAGGSSYSVPLILDGRTIGVFWEDAAYSQLTMSAFNLTTLLGV